MPQLLHSPLEKEAALDRDLERLREQLDTIKSYLMQPLEGTLMDFDWETEDIIHRMFGNSSPWWLFMTMPK